MTDVLLCNPILRVNGGSLERLKLVCSLSANETAIGYLIDRRHNRIVFFRQGNSTGMITLPKPFTMDQCARLSMDWLEIAPYGAKPEHDGDSYKGWLCYTEEWGFIEPYSANAFLAVEPQWMMHGK